MRLFVAVEVPDEVKEKVAALAKELPQDAITPVRPQNMHLTLKFIGEVDDAEEIRERLRKINFQKFSCSAQGVGVFPSEDYIRVVWAAVESVGKLEALAKDVSDSLKGFGKEEEKGFTAHLTIARVKKKIDARPFLAKHKSEAFGAFDVSSFRLMQSELGPAGPKYTVIEEFHARE